MSTASVTKVAAEALLGGVAGGVNVSTVQLEVAIPSITPDPTTPTGAGVTKVAAEVLMTGGLLGVHVSTVQLEVLLSDATPAPGGGAPAASVHAFGYAG